MNFLRKQGFLSGGGGPAEGEGDTALPESTTVGPLPTSAPCAIADAAFAAANEQSEAQNAKAPLPRTPPGKSPGWSKRFAKSNGTRESSQSRSLSPEKGASENAVEGGLRSRVRAGLRGIMSVRQKVSHGLTELGNTLVELVADEDDEEDMISFDAMGDYWGMLAGGGIGASVAAPEHATMRRELPFSELTLALPGDICLEDGDGVWVGLHYQAIPEIHTPLGEHAAAPRPPPGSDAYYTDTFLAVAVFHSRLLGEAALEGVPTGARVRLVAALLLAREPALLVAGCDEGGEPWMAVHLVQELLLRYLEADIEELQADLAKMLRFTAALRPVEEAFWELLHGDGRGEHAGDAAELITLVHTTFPDVGEHLLTAMNRINRSLAVQRQLCASAPGSPRAGASSSQVPSPGPGLSARRAAPVMEDSPDGLTAGLPADRQAPPGAHPVNAGGYLKGQRTTRLTPAAGAGLAASKAASMFSTIRSKFENTASVPLSDFGQTWKANGKRHYFISGRTISIDDAVRSPRSPRKTPSESPRKPRSRHAPRQELPSTPEKPSVAIPSIPEASEATPRDPHAAAAHVEGRSPADDAVPHASPTSLSDIDSDWGLTPESNAVKWDAAASQADPHAHAMTAKGHAAIAAWLSEAPSPPRGGAPFSPADNATMTSPTLANPLFDDADDALESASRMRTPSPVPAGPAELMSTAATPQDNPLFAEGPCGDTDPACTSGADLAPMRGSFEISQGVRGSEARDASRRSGESHATGRGSAAPHRAPACDDPSPAGIAAACDGSSRAGVAAACDDSNRARIAAACGGLEGAGTAGAWDGPEGAATAATCGDPKDAGVAGACGDSSDGGAAACDDDRSIDRSIDSLSMSSIADVSPAGAGSEAGPSPARGPPAREASPFGDAASDASPMRGNPLYEEAERSHDGGGIGPAHHNGAEGGVCSNRPASPLGDMASGATPVRGNPLFAEADEPSHEGRRAGADEPSHERRRAEASRPGAAAGEREVEEAAQAPAQMEVEYEEVEEVEYEEVEEIEINEDYMTKCMGTEEAAGEPPAADEEVGLKLPEAGSSDPDADASSRTHESCGEVSPADASGGLALSPVSGQEAAESRTEADWKPPARTEADWKLPARSAGTMEGFLSGKDERMVREPRAQVEA